MALKQLCRSCGCSNYRLEGHNFCEKHLFMEKSSKPDYSRFSQSSNLYHCDRWRKERKEYLKRNPYCVKCGEPATVVDHSVPHREDEELFWNKDNWQSLCAECHKKKTWQEMRARHTTPF